VSFTGPDGIRHSANIQAETPYEAVILAIRECELEVEARSPSVTQTASMAKVQDWLGSSVTESERQDHEVTAEGISRVLAR
jgi:hypothetical protein